MAQINIKKAKLVLFFYFSNFITVFFAGAMNYFCNSLLNKNII